MWGLLYSSTWWLSQTKGRRWGRDLFGWKEGISERFPQDKLPTWVFLIYWRRVLCYFLWIRAPIQNDCLAGKGEGTYSHGSSLMSDSSFMLYISESRPYAFHLCLSLRCQWVLTHPIWSCEGSFAQMAKCSFQRAMNKLSATHCRAISSFRK